MLPTIVIILFAFLFGITLGSFLNVVICRYGSGMTLGGRSMCTSCGTHLRFFELVPLLSFLFQRGACRTCSSKISWIYPVIEIVGGVVLAWIVWMASIIEFNSIWYLIGWVALNTLFHFTLIAIFVYDYRHKIIPDLFSAIVACSALGLLLLAYLDMGWSVYIYNQILAGPILALPFILLWLVSKGRWLGLGDGKLAFGLGWYLGLSYGAAAMLLAVWIGAVIGIAIIIFQYVRKNINNNNTKRLSLKSEIPFGPFMIIGTWLAIVLGVNMQTIINIFSAILY